MYSALASVLVFCFLGFQLFFILKAREKYKDKIKKEESIIGQSNLTFLYGVAEPWKTKYCWAGIVQVVLFGALVIYYNS